MFFANRHRIVNDQLLPCQSFCLLITLGNRFSRAKVLDDYISCTLEFFFFFGQIVELFLESFHLCLDLGQAAINVICYSHDLCVTPYLT